MLNSDRLKLVRINSNSLKPQITAISNLGQTPRTFKVTFKISDQVAWLFGAASGQAPNIMYQIGTAAIVDYCFGKYTLSITHNSGYDATFTTPPWFRGIIISYEALDISID